MTVFLCLFVANPVGVLIASGLAPVIVDKPYQIKLLVSLYPLFAIINHCLRKFLHNFSDMFRIDIVLLQCITAIIMSLK